jgi:DNA-binding GntR family transcriptional regulator
VDALNRGDGEAAAQAARDHLLIQGQRFTDLMSLTARPVSPDAPVRSLSA